MRITPSQKAIDIYSEFKKKEGSQHIATPVSIEVLLRLNPKTVIEMGGGIGTLTYTLTSLGASVDVYEDNVFCQRELNKNVSGHNLLKDYDIVPPRKEYDLLIVDGATGKWNDGGSISAVDKILNSLESVKHVYIEGGRNMQRSRVRKILKRKYVYTLTNFTGDMKGGLLIKCRKSPNRIFRLANYIFWEIIEWTAIKNFLIYRLRKYLRLSK